MYNYILVFDGAFWGGSRISRWVVWHHRSFGGKATRACFGKNIHVNMKKIGPVAGRKVLNVDPPLAFIMHMKGLSRLGNYVNIWP